MKGLARAAGLYEIADALGVDMLTGLIDPRRDAGPFSALERHLSSGQETGLDLERVPAETAQQARGQIDAFRAVFGTSSRAGGAIFFDAIPADRAQLELDIINPHYPQYYQGSQPPANWQSPIPVYFLTVARDTEFRFAVGWRDRARNGWQPLLAQAVSWLRLGLSELGAGGKTSAGYGYFAFPAAKESSMAAVPASTGLASLTAPLQPQSGQEAIPTEERRGTIVEIRPDLRFGRVKDDETGREYRFQTRVIQGKTPPRRSSVIFLLRGDEVIELRRQGR